MKYVLLFFIFSISLQATEIVTDRPDQTESSTTVPKGAFQIETGVLITNSGLDNTNLNTQEILMPTTLFRYGLLKGVELRLVSNYVRLEQAGNDAITGMSDLQFSSKIRLIEMTDKNNTEIAVLGSVNMLTGNDAFRSEGQAFARILAAHNINENLAIGYNLGYTYNPDDMESLFYSVSLGIGINDKTGIFVETYGDVFLNFEPDYLFDTGFTYKLNPKFQLDFSYGASFVNQMNFLSFGFSWLAD